MSRLRVIGRPTACSGFALAGLNTREVHTPGDAASAIALAAADDELGVLLLEQWALNALDDRSRRELLRRPSPIIVPFPGPAWGERAASADAFVLDLLHRAIGYRVRLR